MTDDQVVTPSTAPVPAARPVTEVTLAELVTRARGLVAAGRRSLAAGGGRSLLGVTGTPGAGKSTLCAALLDALGEDAVLVGMDGFHLANAELARLGRAGRKGAFDTFDVDGYTALLRRLRHQSADVVYAPVFDRSLEESIGSAVPVPAQAPLVVTEGNYLLLTEGGWAGVGEHLDETWFLDVAPEVREQRLVRRRQSHGHSAAESHAWVSEVDERNAAVTDTTRERADLLVHLRTRLGRGRTAPAARTPTAEQPTVPPSNEAATHPPHHDPKEH